MANEIIRPDDLPPRANPVASEVVPSDNGAIVAGVTWADGVNAGRPLASQSEAEAGVNATKAMTPLTTKQAIDAQAITGLTAGENVTISGPANNPVIDATAELNSGDKGDVSVITPTSEWRINRKFDAVAALLADDGSGPTGMGYAGSGAPVIVTVGDIVTAQGFRYEVAASGASDHHVTTDGGVKLYEAGPVFTLIGRLARMTGSAVISFATLTQEGRAGRFVWHGGDLSTEVAADTQQGLYVAPASDPSGASGAWVRQFDGPVLTTWFGAHPDNPDNTAIYDALIAVCPAGSTIQWPSVPGEWAGFFHAGDKSFRLVLGEGNVFCEKPQGGAYGGPIFWFEGAKSQITTLTDDVQYGQLVLTMASTSGLSVGSIIELEDDTTRPTDNGLVNQEILRVAEVISGTQIRVDDMCRSYQDFGTKRVYLLDTIKGVQIDGAGAHIRINNPWDIPNDVGYYGDAILIRYGENCHISGVEVSNHHGPAHLRECIESSMRDVYHHDGPNRAGSGGSYGPSCYIGRDIHFEGIRSVRTRNIIDFHAVYNGVMRDIDGRESNSIGVLHNGFGGNILIERATIDVVGANRGISGSVQGRTDGGTKMIVRDLTIRDIKFKNNGGVTNPAQVFTGIYLDQSWANLVVENVTLMGGQDANPSPGNARMVAMRLDGYPAGPTLIRNVSQASSSDLPYQNFYVDVLVYLVGPADVTSRSHFPIIVEDCQAFDCWTVVRASGVKHLVTQNLTTRSLRGSTVKEVSTYNMIANVTNESIGLHGAYS